MNLFDKKDKPIEIAYAKYMDLSLGTLQTLCSK